MPDRQLTFETNDIAHLVNSAYGKLRIGAFGDAAKVLESALELDVEYEGITAILKSVRFWGERRRRLFDLEENDRAAYLLDQWAAFRGFAARIDEPTLLVDRALSLHRGRTIENRRCAAPHQHA